MPKTAPLPVEKVFEDIKAWCVGRNMVPPKYCYTKEQWKARGETMCNDSHGTIIIEDCDLFAPVNGPGAEDPEDQPALDALLADFTDLLNTRGYYYELGYQWTMHLYWGFS